MSPVGPLGTGVDVTVRRTHRATAWTRAPDSQESLTSAASVARMSVHGVSIDEEIVALVTYQRALEAASRVMTAIDEALDTLVNRTGPVGR